MLRRIVLSPSDRFGKLAIVKEVDGMYWGKYRHRRFLCKCDCGKELVVRLEYLRNGHTQSCGCNRAAISGLVRKTHGCAKTRLHGIWGGMLTRCRNKNVKSYKNYGAKGVTVCEDWKMFENFMGWALSNGYQEHLTIDRKNPYGNYEPDNCRWATRLEQAQNKRDPVEKKL